MVRKRISTGQTSRDDLPGQGESADPGHIHIQHRDVRPRLFYVAQRGLTVAGLGDDLQPVIALDDLV